MSKHYSKESILEIAGGDEDFASVVVAAFLEEIPPDLTSLEEAVSNDNKGLAYQFAHKMKPNIEMFGIDILKDIKSIEAWTDTTKSVKTIAPVLEKVVTTLNNVFEELKEDF